MRKFVMFLVLGCLLALVTSASAQVSGAIFTTNSTGTEVNANIYDSKDDVYLDGGPGPGAPQGAAGLPDGTYYFQVTDPSGKTLLSTDPLNCRQFIVAAGIITGVTGACFHSTGFDNDHGATTVQLMPYNDTPNNGGEYKAWAMNILDLPSGCNPANVDCAKGTHGFINSKSKTDNYKVRGTAREIDTRFFPDLNKNGYKDDGEDWIDGLGITWTDTLGASNKKWSYLNSSLFIMHEAHVEAVENGTHVISISNQAGCTVGNVFVNGSALKTKGPQNVTISVKPSFKQGTIWVDVACVQ